jgi:DNA-binding transcriptional LysR family regulator
VLAADLQSFTRAAEALDSTQSAISFKLKKLEQRLGRRLLERTPRQVRLSAEGQQFLPAARGLLARMNARWNSWTRDRSASRSASATMRPVPPAACAGAGACG